MDFVHDQLARAASCASWPWSMPTPGYRRWSIPGSAIAPRSWSRLWIGHAGRSAIRKRSGWTMAASLSLGTWICWLTSVSADGRWHW